MTHPDDLRRRVNEMHAETGTLIDRTFELRDMRKRCEITAEEYERLMDEIGNQIVVIQRRILGDLFVECLDEQ